MKDYFFHRQWRLEAPMQRSKLVLGVVVALGVGGLGAAAVAMESDGGGASLAHHTTTTTEVVADTTTTTSTTIAPTTTVAPSTEEPVAPTDEPVSDGEGVARSTDGCDGGTYVNHGDFVSSVAHNPDRQPGDVAAAAQSDCGKPLTSVGGADEGETPDTPDTTAPTTPDTSGGGNQGQGQGQGQGHGKPAK